MQVSRSSLALIIAVIVLIGGVFLILIRFSSPFVVDDAYISFTYSKNWIQGNGPTYNGMWVEGFSNPLWVVMITPFLWLGIDPLVAARLISVLSVFVILFLMWRIMQRLFPRGRLFSFGLISLVFVINNAVLTWAVSGLETLLTALWVTLIVFLETHPTLKNPLPSALAILALTLTRPEGAMLFPIVLVYHFFQPGYPLRKNVAWTLWVIIPFLVFLMWRLSVYGHPLANTAYIKLTSDVDSSLMPGLGYVISFFLMRPIFTVLLVLSVFLLIGERFSTVDEWFLIIVPILGFIAFAIVVGGDWMPFHRFLVPVMPLLALVIGKVINAESRHKWVQILLKVLGINVLILELIFLALFCRPVFEEFDYHRERLTEAGMWIQANTEPDTVIAVVDAGMLAYYSERTTIDIIGLNNDHIAHSENDSDPEYVLSYKPLLVQLHAKQSEDGTWYDPDSKAGNDLLNFESFFRLYQPAEIDASRPGWPFFFMRIE